MKRRSITCPCCGRPVSLRKDSSAPLHTDPSTRKPCPGSGLTFRFAQEIP